MKKRSDRNSVVGQVQQAQTAKLGLAQWPTYGPALPDDDVQAQEIRNIFEGIVACRPAEAWSGPDVVRACHLAILLQLQNDNFHTLATDGPLSPNKRGTMVVSPRLYASDKLGQSVAQLTRQLGLNAQHMGGGDPRAARRGNEQFRQAHGQGMANGAGSGPVIDLKALLE